MRYILTLIVIVSLSMSSIAEVREYSPVKVLVDIDKGTVIREPSQMDYDHYKDAFKLEKPRSLKDLILGKRGCGK